ncbi:hypothetical protein KW464_07745 [Vibrio fluvialis]|nr:hypothetical protein [Vibrio fluvialis]
MSVPSCKHNRSTFPLSSRALRGFFSLCVYIIASFVRLQVRRAVLPISAIVFLRCPLPVLLAARDDRYGLTVILSGWRVYSAAVSVSHSTVMDNYHRNKKIYSLVFFIPVYAGQNPPVYSPLLKVFRAQIRLYCIGLSLFQINILADIFVTSDVFIRPKVTIYPLEMHTSVLLSE